jgi:hypothetical protein
MMVGLDPGTDDMIAIKYFRFCLKTKLIMQKLDHNNGFGEKRQLFSQKNVENRRKL